jgi:hypothetical protein
MYRRCHRQPNLSFGRCDEERATAPPNFHLQLIKANPRAWAPVVVAMLLTELRARDPHLFDNLAA